MIEWFEKTIDFSNILNISITASWLILVVIGLRLVFRKAPKWVRVALWGIVALRLLMPFSIESSLSLVPSVETVSHQLLQAEPEYSHGDAQLDILANPNYGSFVSMDLDDSMDSFQWSMVKMSLVWYAGIAAMSIYTVMSFIILRRKLRTAVILRGNLFQCETVSSPFVLGILKPKIYLPYGMDDQNLSHVIAHEQAHIRRKDHWWKPLGFLLLTIHWFNPLMWVAYILLCRDIELACDEKVIAELGNEQRADYTQALVACAVNRRMIAACPLAFGEVGVKERIKSVMNYKKPAFWIIVIALVVCVVVAVCFLTDPAGTSLTQWKIDEVDMRDTLEDMRAMTVRYYDDSITCGESDINRFIATMDKIKVGSNSLSRSRDENRDHTFTITINDRLHLHFSFDFSEIWVDNGVKPSFSYPITNPETAREFMLDFSFTQKVTVEQWFDYSDNPSEMQWDGRMEANIPELPDVTFRWYPGKMEAITDQGITTLYTGMPIWSAYFCDLTGDDVPEICSQVSYGSGIIDNRVIVYDYANGASYSLIDRGYHDYYLRINDADGYLYVDKKVYNSEALVSSGQLVYRDGCILIDPSLDIGTSSLQEKYPEYFGLDTSNGLDVYVWQMNQNSYSFGVLPHKDTPRDWISAELMNLRGADAREMRLILKSYGLEESDIHIIPWQNLYSSYIADIWIIGDDVSQEDKQMQYIEQIREMLFPSEEVATPVETAPTESPVDYGMYISRPEMSFPGLEADAIQIDENWIEVQRNGASLEYHMTYDSPAIILEFGLLRDDGLEIKATVEDGVGKDTLENIPAGRYQLFVRNIGYVNDLPGKTVNGGAVNCTLYGGTTDDMPIDPDKIFVDLTQGEVNIKVEDIANYIFYTNSMKIVVKVKGGKTDSGIVNLHPAESTELFVGTHELHGKNQCVFTGLTSARYYLMSIENLTGCELTVSGEQSLLEIIFG